MNQTLKEEQPIRILIADDHPVVREGLAAIIERRPDMTVVGEATNGREAIALFSERLPDVTLMDLSMPEIGGVQATKAIRAKFPSARILVLTTYDGDEDIYQGLRAGARGYLLKDAGRESLLAAIRAVQNGQRYLPMDVASKLTDRLSTRELTGREMEVLQQMASGKSNQEIGGTLFIAEGTVKAHITNILAKLDVADRTQAVVTALKRGLLHLE